MLKFKNNIVGAFLLSLGCGALALSLGEMRGAAWVGQSLDLRVAVHLDEPLNSDSNCFEAEVIYGEAHQSRVRVSLEPSPQAALATIRIQSLNPVNEPVVTVNLKADCLAKKTRRYVLLADVPMGQASQPGNINATNGVAAPAVSPPVLLDAVETARTQTNPRVGTASTASKNRSLARPADSTTDKPTKPASRPAVKTQTRKSRLSLDLLDPLELRFERVQQDIQLQTRPIQLAELPADAPLQGLVETQDAQRFKKLEMDVQSMQAQAVKSEQGMTQLREQLKQAQAERYDNGLVYALIVFLLAALAYLAYSLRRQAQAQAMISEAWFESVQAANDKPEKAMGNTPVSIAQTTSLAVGETGSSPDLSHVNLDNLISFSDDEAAVPVLPHSNQNLDEAAQLNASNSKLQFSRPGVKTDPRQHADFLVSLGQSDQAIKVLNAAIHDDEKINPMVYLELFKIYHAMGMRDDYRLLSDRFSILYKARVPEYVKFRHEGQDLSAYEEVIAQISLYWSTPKAVDAINTFIYADADEDSELMVDLQAFRELLLLRAVALSKLDAPQPAGRTGREMNSVSWQG